MALKLWLPLTGDLRNNGLAEAIITNDGATINANGKIGNCYEFNNTHIIIDSTEIQEIFSSTTQPFSFAVWIYLNSDETDRVIIFGNYSANPFVNWELASNCTQRLCAGGASNYTNRTNSTVVPKTTWTHLAVTYDGTTTVFYQNGVAVGTVAGVNTLTTQTGNSRFYLGSDARNDVTRLKGRMNDFRLYDHALSPKEIKEISKGLVLHYPLNNNGEGGRNLLRKGTGVFHNTAQLTSISWTGWDSYNSTSLTDIDWNNHYGDYITYSCYVENISQTVGTGSGIMLHFRYADGTYQQFGGGKNGTIGSYLAQGESGWLQITVAIPNASTRSNPTTISYVQASIRHNSSDGASTIKYQFPQVELGKKRTSWSWAPEDRDEPNIIYDCSGYGHHGWMRGGSYDQDTPRYDLSAKLFGTTVDTTSNTVTGAQYFMGNLSLPASTALTVSWWGKNIIYGRGGIFETTSTTFTETTGANGTDYNTTAIANWDSTFGIYNGSSRVNIFSQFKKDGNWHHHVIVFDGTKVYYYCDNTLLTNSALTGTLPAFNGIRMGLGRAGWVHRQIQQCVSDLRIYTTALSADDIRQLYKVPAMIDNVQNLYAYQFIEDDKHQVQYTGVFDGVSYIEDTKTQIHDDGQVKSNYLYEL